MALRIKITEAAFTAQVLAMARLHGWRSAHFRPARTKTGWRTAVAGDGVGFPDLLLVRARTKQMLVAELKVPPNRTTPEQDRWLAEFEVTGVAAYTWTPADWNEIARVLEQGPELR
jgi:hypothetical protein